MSTRYKRTHWVRRMEDYAEGVVFVALIVSLMTMGCVAQAENLT